MSEKVFPSNLTQFCLSRLYVVFSFAALLPQQVPYQDEKQRERLTEKLKEKDEFCNKLYPKIQNLKAYASASGVVYGITDEEPLKPLNLGDPTSTTF